MAINPKYMIASSLQEYFVDKETGQPLSGGIVSFYKDSDRVTPKPVYTLSGTPPNYSYTELPNPLILSAVGTPQYNGNDIVIYYYPYDDNGNVELYYVTVTASDTTPQFTREAWPNFSLASNPSNAQDLINYIPNPQFIAHTNLPADPNTSPPILAGQVTQPITDIAQGGWTFERPAGSLAIDFITFFRYGSFVNEPTQSPRYAVEINTTSPSLADAYKNLCINFMDVNKFTDNPTPAVVNQVYTFYFEAQTVVSANFDVGIKIIKNFGDGGSSPVTLSFGSVTITNNVTAFTTVLDFGENSAYTIGGNNDDYVQVVLSFPTNTSFNGIFTNFILTVNNVEIDAFPTTTDDDMLARSLVPPPPNPDGSDLYLPLVLTQTGLIYDDSEIGVVLADTTAPTPNKLSCDGTSYLVEGYSPIGIPYRRLFNKWYDPTTLLSKYGNGVDYWDTINLNSNRVFICTNSFGLQSTTSDGALPTGFTFQTIAFGASSYGFLTYFWNGGIQIRCENVGSVSGTTSNGTTTSSVYVAQTGFDAAAAPQNTFHPGAMQVVLMTNLSALPSAGQYFEIATPVSQYVPWYQINGTGSIPGVSGIKIPINLDSAMTAEEAMIATFSTLFGSQISLIKTVSGASITANSYFNFYANGTHYVPWFALNGVGIAPVVANAILIKVSYNASQSDVEIAQTLTEALNSVYFAVPDLSIAMLKGLGQEEDSQYRYSRNPFVTDNMIGSFQLNDVLDHTHVSYEEAGGNPQHFFGDVAGNSVSVKNTVPYGAIANRVYNTAVNWVVKY